MTNPNFTTTFSVDQTPEEAFGAIKNVRGWWSEEIEGSTDQLGDEFTYRYKDVHHCKMKLIEVIPHKKVVWHLDVTPKGRAENGPHHSLGDWARPRNMYGQGGVVEANGRYHAPSCACAVHK